MLTYIRRISLALIFIIAIFSYGLFLRYYHISTPSLWIDEGYSINASMAILQKGIPLLDSGRMYAGGFLQNYLTAGSMAIFGFDGFAPWSARLPALIFGSLVPLAVAILAWILFRLPPDETTHPFAKASGQAPLTFSTHPLTPSLTETTHPLTPSRYRERGNLLRGSELYWREMILPGMMFLIMTFSEWEIVWSRQARGYALMTFFLALTFIAFWHWFEKRDVGSLAIFLFLFAFAYASHSVAMIFLPAFVGTVIAHHVMFPKKRFSKKNLFIAGCAIALASLIIIPRFNTFDSPGYRSTYISYLFGFLMIVTLPALIGFLLGLFDKRRSWPVLFLFINFFIPLIVMIEYGPMSQTRYLFTIFPIMVLLACYGVMRIGEIATLCPWISRPISNAPKKSMRLKALHVLKWSIFLTPSLLFIVMLFLSGALQIKPIANPSLEWDSPQPDFRSAYETIQLFQTRDDRIVSPYTPLTRIYLNTTGYWLPMSLTGKRDEITNNTINGRDYYTNAEIAMINNEETKPFSNITSGFLVVDGLTEVRIKTTLDAITRRTTTRLLYHSGQGLDEVWVYQF